MGGAVETANNLSFKVNAVGAFKQKPGCPDYSSTSLTSEDLETICKNECYNPSDERKVITRIEVIKITPQINASENVNNLIQDPLKVFDCP